MLIFLKENLKHLNNYAAQELLNFSVLKKIWQLPIF